MNKKVKRIIYYILPFAAALVSAVLYFAIPESGKQKQMNAPYYMCFLLAAVLILAVSLIAGIFAKDFGKKLQGKLPFYAGLILFIALLNTIFSKTRLLPVLYFPSIDRITGLLWEQKVFLIKNLIFSLGLLSQGFILGLLTGFFFRAGTRLQPPCWLLA